MHEGKAKIFIALGGMKVIGYTDVIQVFFLILGGLLEIGFVLFFADNTERVAAQAMLVSAVTVFVVASLIMIHFLDSPYTGQSGSVEPSAMRQSLRSIEFERRARHQPGALPCSPRGRPVRA